MMCSYAPCCFCNTATDTKAVTAVQETIAGMAVVAIISYVVLMHAYAICYKESVTLIYVKGNFN
jgi:hypothetical protein